MIAAAATATIHGRRTGARGRFTDGLGGIDPHVDAPILFFLIAEGVGAAGFHAVAASDDTCSCD